MSPILILAAATLPVPPETLGTLHDAADVHLPRMVFGCDSADNKVGLLLDVRHDSNGNYARIVSSWGDRAADKSAKFDAPIKHSASKQLDDSYVLQVSTDPQSDGSQLTIQIQSVNHAAPTAWFNLAGPKALSGLCPFKLPAPAERG